MKDFKFIPNFFNVPISHSRICHIAKRETSYHKAMILNGQSERIFKQFKNFEGI